jgi:hypothetical protein
MRRLANILVLIVAVGVLYGMQQTKPRFGELTAPIPVYGKMHDKVRTREFDVTLDQVVFARQLDFTQYGEKKTLTTSGLWVIVTAQLAATTSSTSVAAPTWLGPTGLKFTTSGRIDWAPGMPPHLLAPGLPKKVRFIFETMPDQVNGATLVLSGKIEPALDSEARISIDDLKTFNDGQPLVIDSYDPLRPLTGT